MKTKLQARFERITRNPVAADVSRLHPFGRQRDQSGLTIAATGLEWVLAVRRSAFLLLAAVTLFATPPRALAQTGWGSALKFDGVDDFVRIANFAQVMPTNEVTIEFWLKVEEAKNQVAFALDPDDPANRFLAHVPWSDGVVYWDFGNLAGTGRLVYQPSTPFTGTWQHFAFIASRIGPGMGICRNGVPVAYKQDCGILTRGACDLLLGGIANSGMRGQMDEVRIWNRALNLSEIQTNMLRSLSGTEPGLVGYWKFDEGNGAIVHDATANHLDGVLVGDPVWQPGGAIPGIRISRDTDTQAQVSWNTVDGWSYQLQTAPLPTLPFPWQSFAPPIPGYGLAVTQSVALEPSNRFFQIQASPTPYGVVDVMVADNYALVPAEYTGLAYFTSTRPFIPGRQGERVIGQDVNVGIGGTTTHIWVKYAELGPGTTAARALTDIAVQEWPNWNAICPDGHLLVDNLPCPDGWQRASGASSGIPGALTTGTEGDCHRIGLCVRYRPANEVVFSNRLFIEKLSLSFSANRSPAIYPAGEIGWQSDTQDIHAGCGDDRWVYLCYAKRGIELPAAFSDAQKLEQLQRYAPLIWQAQGELFMPSSVEWAFPYLERFLNTDGNYWLRTRQALSSPSDLTLPVFRGDLASAPIYAFWTEKQRASVVDLVYFAYYPYNRGKTLLDTVWGNHVSDWEHITVRLIWGQPAALYVSAHSFGFSYDWNRVAKAFDTHPILYSAQGSHGFWVFPGVIQYQSTPVGGLYDICNAGTPWSTWDRVEAYDYYAQRGLSGKTWPNWLRTDFQTACAVAGCDPSMPESGPIYRWGNPKDGCEFEVISGECRLNDGPSSPALSGAFFRELFQ